MNSGVFAIGAFTLAGNEIVLCLRIEDHTETTALARACSPIIEGCNLPIACKNASTEENKAVNPV